MKNFRVYDEVEKKMYYDGFYVTPDGTVIWRNVPEEEQRGGILMEDTGRLDKNENKIWEDDQVSAEWHCLLCFDNEPHVAKGYIEWDNDGLWMINFGHTSLPLASSELGDIEVLEYEPPEPEKNPCKQNEQSSQSAG